MKKILFIFILFIFSNIIVAHNSYSIKPYYAEYDFYWGGIKVAKLYSSLELEKNNNINLYLAKTDTKSTLFFMSYKDLETSKFQLKNNTIIPLEYTLQSSKQNNKIQTTKNSLDKINHLFQLNLDIINNKNNLEYRVVKPNKISKYTYKILDKEILETNIGKLDTIKVINHTGSDKNKYTLLWICPKLNYIIVKMQQYKKNKLSNELLISSFR